MANAYPVSPFDGKPYASKGSMLAGLSRFQAPEAPRRAGGRVEEAAMKLSMRFGLGMELTATLPRYCFGASRHFYSKCM
jgi:hypothetical protein